MITLLNILGFRRVLILGILLSLNVLLASSHYLYFVPQKDVLDRELRTLRGKATTMQADIARLQLEFEQLTEQRAEFEKLKQNGFFSNQDRSQAQQVLQQIQRESRVVTARAEVKAGVLNDNEEAAKAEHKILISPISITARAIDDIDLFRYIKLLETEFPGHVSFQSVEINREADLTNPVLRSISSGESPGLVTAKFEIMWQTMIPQSDVIKSGSAP